MKVTVKDHLNARSGAPFTTSTNPYYREPGEVMEIQQVLIGQEIEGVSVWYLCDYGQYYCSGGFAETDFELPGVNISELKESDQYALLKECVNAFYTLYSKNVATFTGLGVSRKKRGGNYHNHLSLVVQVAVKGSANFEIKPLRYKGFRIPTDVDPASKAKPITPGAAVSRVKSLNTGTIGFYGNDGADDLLVTNYHVVCDHLITTGKLKYDIPNGPPFIDVQTPAASLNLPISLTGKLKFGILSEYRDLAIVKLPPGIYLNRNGINTFSGHIELSKVQDSTQVQVWGSRFNTTTLVGRYHSEPIDYPGLSKDHVLSGLIKLDLCTIPGDSGSPIVFNNKLVGIVVAEDSMYTYGIPIETILTPTLKVL
jgi:hypothetical protein